MRRIAKDCPPWEVRAEVRDGGATRPLVIEVGPCELRIRQKGRRKAYPLPWAAIYVMAAKAEAERLAKERRSRKGLERRAKGRTA